MAQKKEIYQLKVTLRHVRPPIWRRLQVPSDIKLGKLHEVLQAAMGWNNSHLHQFVIGRDCYGIRHGVEFDGEVLDENRYKLAQVAGKSARFTYEYDFGDGWDHQIVVEKILAAEPKVRYPRCLAGKRACPPDDSGGPHGYSDFVDAFADPAHRRHQEVRDWIGDSFDAEAFNLDEVNELIR